MAKSDICIGFASPESRKLPVRPIKSVEHVNVTIPEGEILAAEQKATGCRYVEGEVSVGGSWRYCQKPQMSNSPYCHDHHKACRIPPPSEVAPP